MESVTLDTNMPFLANYGHIIWRGKKCIVDYCMVTDIFCQWKPGNIFMIFFLFNLVPNILNRVCQMPVFSVQYSQVEQSPIESKSQVTALSRSFIKQTTQ